MAVTTTITVNNSNKRCEKHVLAADTDVVIGSCRGAKSFSMDVKGVTADTVALYFTNSVESSPAAGDWKQWKTSAGVNPWAAANDLARGSIDYNQYKILRSGAADGAGVTATICLSK